MNEMARELNAVLSGTVVARLMSDLGIRMFFPKGIVAQSVEAGKAAYTCNATAGVACSDGKPILLPTMSDLAPALTPAEFVAYAPTLGDASLRSLWRQEILRKNPSISGQDISLPAVVPGLTSGISLTADLFVDENDTVILPDLSWDNYQLIFGDRKGAALRTFPLFDGEGGLNCEGIRTTLSDFTADSKIVLMLNFPNNPTGYSPTVNEAEKLAGIILEAAERGCFILAVCDDAYFGLFYESETFRESLFSRLASLHGNILAVKVDGPTKEDFVWGFRIGFLTFGSKNLTQAQYSALEEKLKGAVRSSFSSSSRPAQSMLLKAMESSIYAEEREARYKLLHARYAELKRIVSEMKKTDALALLPFNSGYFLCFRIAGGRAEILRSALLHEEGIGTVSLDRSHLRVAWAAVDTWKLPLLFEKISTVSERCRP